MHANGSGEKKRELFCVHMCKSRLVSRFHTVLIRRFCEDLNRDLSVSWKTSNCYIWLTCIPSVRASKALNVQPMETLFLFILKFLVQMWPTPLKFIRFGTSKSAYYNEVFTEIPKLKLFVVKNLPTAFVTRDHKFHPMFTVLVQGTYFK